MYKSFLKGGDNMFNTDKPINLCCEDTLQRSSFAKNLAKAVISYSKNDNFTISVCGKWGSGKTSILNMMEEEIKKTTSSFPLEERPIIVHFNPWNYSDSSQLITQFFKSISSQLKHVDNNKIFTKLSDAIDSYSDLIDYIPDISYASVIKTILKGSSKTLRTISSKNSDLNKTKENIIDLLKSQNQKIIVIIDDIDRLNNEQIRLIFQLVNSIAGFPNMIYILSFDRSIVSRALEDVQKCDGEEYLEKIIQVPFDIPRINKALVDKTFSEKFSNIILTGEYIDKTFEKDYWHTIFLKVISPFINSLRDVNRIINTFGFEHNMMKNEINCIDLLALSTLKICSPKIYEWIYQNKSYLTGSVMNAGGISGIEQNNNKKSYIEQLKSFGIENAETVLPSIQALFPKFSWLTGGYWHTHETLDELKRKHKIASPDRFDRYFFFNLSDIYFSSETILDLINNFSEEEIQLFFDNCISDDSLYLLLTEISSYLDTIPPEREYVFINEFIKFQTKDQYYNHNSSLLPTIATICSNNIRKILSKNSQETNALIINTLINEATLTNIHAICEIIDTIERAYMRYGKDFSSQHQFLKECDLDIIENIILPKIKELLSDNCLFDLIDCEYVYFIWNHLEQASLNKHITKALTSNINAPKFIDFFASHWHSSSFGYGWSFNVKNFENYISSEKLYNNILSLKNTVGFKNLKSNFQESAIAYSMWFVSGKSDSFKISQNEVLKILPEWL